MIQSGQNRKTDVFRVRGQLNYRSLRSITAVIQRIQPAEVSPSIQRMLAVSVFKPYRAREVILHQGSVSEQVYYLLKGSVIVEMYNENGQRLVFDYIRPGHFFGEMAMFDEGLRRSATVTAKTECEVAVVPISRFRKLVEDDPELLMELTRQLAFRLRATSERLSNLAFLDVTGRVARVLIDLAARDEAVTHPEGRMIRITREELGRLVNCSREMAGQVLHGLEDQGLILLEGRSIVVRHPD
ncbi:MAG: transcriptional regulator Crp [Proteobacteria bacterium]|nr:MAG: transcriptional regulator Crp [Pseudomonadota bacterium]